MNDKLTCLGIIAFVSLLVLIIYDSQSVIGQSTNASSFTTYQNPAFGFSIQYPTDWKIIENAAEGIVKFNTGGKVPIFTITITKVEPYLDTETLTLKNTTLYQYVKKKLNAYSQQSPDIGSEFNLIHHYAVPIGSNKWNNDVWKIEYTSGDFYSYEVLAIVNGKLYVFQYKDAQLNVPKTIPLANKVLASFVIMS